jgi:hypothetical protein
VPRGYGLYVLWAKFAKHCQQESARNGGGRYLIHRGGLAGLADLIAREAKECSAKP